MKSKALKIGIIILSLILIVGAVGCTGKSSTPATAPVTFVTRTEFDSLAGRVTSVETTQRQYGTGQASAADVAQLKVDLATLKARVDALPPSADVATLKTQVANLLERVSDLETPSGGATTGEATIDIDYSGSIRLDGTYKITLTITNNTGQVLKDSVVTLSFTPRASAVVDRTNTYLDSTKSPFLGWDATFSPSNWKTEILPATIPKTYTLKPTAYFYFESDSFSVAKGETKLYLSLTLAYIEEAVAYPAYTATTTSWTPEVYIDYTTS